MRQALHTTRSRYPLLLRGCLPTLIKPRIPILHLLIQIPLLPLFLLDVVLNRRLLDLRILLLRMRRVRVVGCCALVSM